MALKFKQKLLTKSKTLDNGITFFGTSSSFWNFNQHSKILNEIFIYF